MIYEPLTFRNGASIKNRVALCALTNRQSHEDGTVGDAEVRFLGMRADGGFGIVTTCASHVSKDGQGWGGELGIFDEAHVPGLTKLSARIREAGAAAFVQIFHGGVRADASASGLPRFSASAREDSAGIVRAATEGDIQRVIRQFGDAAARAHAANMTGVEIHGAHGYLITQFLSATENTRTDGWGGTIENRARLLLEILRSVRSRVPSSFVVGVRMSPEDWGNAKGLDLDESLRVATWIAEEGADFVHLSLWDAFQNTKKRPDEHPLEAFRNVVPSEVKIFAAGHIWSRQDAEQLLARGADVVALGRAAIVNPRWPTQAKEPNFEPTRPPLTPEQFGERGVAPGFVDYLRQWKNFVA